MKDRVVIGILLAAVLLVYGNTMVNQFAMDDGLYIQNNLQVTDPSLHRLFSPNQYSNVFRPVTFATLAMNWALAGDDPSGYHLWNLLLHAGVVLLLYLLLLAIFEVSPHGKMLAFTAALLFAVHPIHADAVASVVGRSEMLAAGFLLAAWIFHLQDRWIASLACFVLALLSKESAVAFLPLVIVGDYAVGKWKPRVRYAQIGGATLLYLAVLWNVQGGRFGPPGISFMDNPLASLPAGWRILNAFRVSWKYAALHFYPAILSCDYSFNQIPVYRDWRHTLPAALAAALVVGVWIWAIWKGHKGWALAGAIYLAGFATTANILIPTGTILGERLAYLPSAGFCLLLALAWSWLKDRQQKVAWGVIGILVLAFAVRTIERNADWKDNFSLSLAAVRAAPASAKMHSNLGGQYLIRNQPDLARAEFQSALQINPDFPDALASYGILESSLGNYQAAGALLEKAFKMSARNNPNYDRLAVEYAIVMAQTNRSDAAVDLLSREIAESPGYARAWSVRGALRARRGEVEPARGDLETALRLDPGDDRAQALLRALSVPPPVVSSR